MAPSQAPKYLTGDGNAINEFLDKFDVRYFPSSTDPLVFELTCMLIMSPDFSARL